MSAAEPAPRSPTILGCAGPELTPDERRLFRDADPVGFILFARNCRSPDQVRALIAGLRESVGRAGAPVLIDQEGGRVARLGPPHWRAAPSAARFGAMMAAAPETALEAVTLNARLIADDLAALGITVDCAPVLDLPAPGSNDAVIGDRAFSADGSVVSALGRAMAEGLLAGGVLPVVKHIPGHGRARVDSHHALPVVDAGLDALRGSDFRPFKALADMPWAMTAHVVYTALDAANPATTSPTVVRDVIRGWIGFAGVLVSDDLSMKALSGSLRERAAGALIAGCDLALHCNGRRAEMEEVVEGAGRLAPEAWRRIETAAGRPAAGVFDRGAAEARLRDLLAGA